MIWEPDPEIPGSTGSTWVLYKPEKKASASSLSSVKGEFFWENDTGTGSGNTWKYRKYLGLV
jgi:hypothetical protein